MPNLIKIKPWWLTIGQRCWLTFSIILCHLSKKLSYTPNGTCKSADNKLIFIILNYSNFTDNECSFPLRNIKFSENIRLSEQNIYIYIVFQKIRLKQKFKIFENSKNWKNNFVIFSKVISFVFTLTELITLWVIINDLMERAKTINVRIQ